MAKQNVPFLSFNRGLVSPKALGRVDLDRTRLSAEVYVNWLPKTQGAMTIRPGTKWLGSSYNDSGAEWVEFVASTEDVALPEITPRRMRVWLGSDAHNLSLLARPAVNTTLSLTDTGWTNASSGGTLTSGVATDIIPGMTAATTDGVEITASSELTNEGGTNKSSWQVGDNNVSTYWQDTGDGKASTLPSWLNVDFGADTGNRKSVTSYSLRAVNDGTSVNNTPSAWGLIASQYDTGTFATDTGKWTLEDARSAQTGWASSEKRTFELPSADTGTIPPYRHWRLNVTAVPSGVIRLAEIEMFTALTGQQVTLQGGRRILNAIALGGRAKATKRVILSDTGTEHSLAIRIDRGPVTLRVGSTDGDDDYVSEAALGTGYHNLAFTPQSNFWVTLQSDALVDRIVGSMAIGDSGTVEITAPWDTGDLENIRYDQSADVVYVDCDGVRPSKIERRGTGRSWSIVDSALNAGPFLPTASSVAKMSVSHFFGNTTLNSDVPFFTVDHVGALIRAFHEGQGGQWRLGALDAKTDIVTVAGLSDTGTGNDNERRITFAVTGTGQFTTTIERSIDAEDRGFKEIPFATAADTGTRSVTVDDPDDNVKAYYRVRLKSWTSGVAVVSITYPGGGVTGIARITGYNSNTDVDIEVLSRFSDTGPTDNWQQGYWSDARGFPTAVALHGGRNMHAQGGSIFGSVSDDYENFDDTVTGDAGPIIRTLGSGPVDRIRFIAALRRPIIGTAGRELTLNSSSLDEALTPDNAAAVPFSTQGSANLRAVTMDNRAIFVQRSRERVIMVGPGASGSSASFGDYENFELTLLVPDLLAAGVVSIAVQRQPDTRIHCVLGDGKVAILTYEPQEEVICWTLWQSDTGTNPVVEKAMVLPGLSEDAVYYHVRRTINGTRRRYLEKWAKESECVGDTGLSWLMDCAKSYTDTGRTATLTDIATHLVGEKCIVWSDDTGSIPGVDRSPDSDSGVQTTFTPDTGGDITLGVAVHHAVAGLGPSDPLWKSTKLAYAAEAGTALNQTKRVDKSSFSLYNTHHFGFRFGSDTGHLDPLPRRIGGARMDIDHIHATLDSKMAGFPSTWDTDSRITLRGRFPRPATVLAAVPTVNTNEKV